MVPYLLKILGVLLFSLFVIIFYYSDFGDAHSANFDLYGSYLLPVFIIYGIYKYFQSEQNNNIAMFGYLQLIGMFLLNLLILCLFYFGIQNENPGFGYGILLFVKIIGFSILPIFIYVLSLVFGKKIISYFGSFDTYGKVFIYILSFIVGFCVFLTIFDIIGMLGFYNIYTFLALAVGIIIFSYKEIKILFKNFLQKEIVFDIEEGNYLKLISAEFLFWVSSLILGVTLISLIRPFPIGWDDLGVYMNYPQIIANSGEILNLGGMYVWQTFTGIGYLFGSATQAFYLNAFGGFVSFIFLILITKDFLQSEKKGFIYIPLLIATVFISMPMIVFEQAKDMKIDPGLFFISISAVYITIKYFLIEKSYTLNKKNIFLLVVIGALLGFSFTIKFTSILLIISLLGLFFYKRLGTLGFLGYLFVFVFIFTKIGLWEHMKVLLLGGDSDFVKNLYKISALLGIGLLGYSFYKSKKEFSFLLKEIGIIILCMIGMLSPWIIKNIVSAEGIINVSTITTGKADYFRPDFLLIHSKKELYDIKEAAIQSRKTDNGTTANEDFGRYFGYEKGIVNYVKLPWNLTNQINQKGEFTDIGYLFLALIPIIFVFFPMRKKYFSIFIILLVIVELLIFLGFFDPIFSNITLPLGYIVLALGIFIPTFLFLYTLDTKKDNNKISIIKYTTIFISLYYFLWMISAFGIVWYGIVMYFCFLIFIAFGFYYVTSYKEDWQDKKFFTYMFGSLILFLIFMLYIMQSIFPDTLNNLKNARYIEYKKGDFGANEAVFRHHSDYLNILYEVNIDDDKKEDFLRKHIDKNISKQTENIFSADISQVVMYLYKLKNTKNELSLYADTSLQNIFTGILHPSKEFKSKAIIYRVGTFLKYHISDNFSRLLADNLLFKYNDYIFDNDKEVTVNRMKKLGVKYILFDLNTATIDKSTNHGLTNRYEKFLELFSNNKLELVETDSTCLKVALEKYKKLNDTQEFMTLAGGNYDSYTSTGALIPRNDKKIACYQVIIDLMKNKQVDKKNYNYLLPLYNSLSSQSGALDSVTLQDIHSQYGSSFKALFKIK